MGSNVSEEPLVSFFRMKESSGDEGRWFLKNISTHLLNCTVLQNERVESPNAVFPPPPPTSSYNFIDWQEVGTEFVSVPNCITVMGYEYLCHCFCILTFICLRATLLSYDVAR
jgi:hypothetical protein